MEATTITIEIPRPLQAYCGGASQLAVSAASVRAALARMERSYPDVYRSVCDETGAVRRHVNLFVNLSNVRDLDGIDTPLLSGDVLTIMPAVSGG